MHVAHGEMRCLSGWMCTCIGNWEFHKSQSWDHSFQHFCQRLVCSSVQKQYADDTTVYFADPSG